MGAGGVLEAVVADAVVEAAEAAVAAAVITEDMAVDATKVR